MQGQSANSRAPQRECSLWGCPGTRWFVSLVALVVLWNAGCGGDSDSPNTVRVSGKVTLNGQPLTSGEVVFIPKEGGGLHRPGIGQLDDDGTFVLMSFGKEGIEPGDYKVIVRPLPAEDGDKKDAVVTSPIPEKYQSAESSGFEETVDESDKGKVFEFDLK
jgi:hypothetical protein